MKWFSYRRKQTATSPLNTEAYPLIFASPAAYLLVSTRNHHWVQMLIDTLSARGPLFFYSPPAVESQTCRPTPDNICSYASNKTKGRHKEEKYSNGRNSWLCNASQKASLDFSESQQEHCSSGTSQNEHLSIKITLSCAFVKHSSQVSKRSSFSPLLLVQHL